MTNAPSFCTFPTLCGAELVPVATYDLHPVWVRSDMPEWPSPGRLTRRQRRLRGALQAERRRAGAGVPHRMRFATIVGGEMVLV